MRLAGSVLLLLLVPTVAAHGDLAIHELETLAIRDFEGQEDSFAWEGFEIWDVYVGEGYNETYQMDGVYLKVNFAGDGTTRPTGGQSWTVTFRFLVGEEPFEREFTHDGSTVTTNFESLQWMVADGNVLQVKAWVPVESWAGKSVRDIVLVSSVDGEPRDTAPGGVHDPATGRETTVQAPASGVFPPLGEGRVVEEIPLTGPAKFLGVAIEPTDRGTFEIAVTNPLKEQGQHVALRATPTPEWNLTTTTWGGNLEGGTGMSLDLALRPDTPPGAPVPPLELALLTDIGGRTTFYAYLTEAGVALAQDASVARAGVMPGDTRDAPGLALGAIVLAAVVAAATRRR